MGYGYSGDLKGIIHTNKDFDYLAVVVEYYDANNVSLYKTHAYTGSNVKPGAYTWNAFYYEDQKPVRAELRVYNEISSDDPIYSMNIDL